MSLNRDCTVVGFAEVQKEDYLYLIFPHPPLFYFTETRVFEELNVFNFQNTAIGRLQTPQDLDLDFVPEPEPKGCLPYLFSKLKTKSSTNSNSATSTTITTNDQKATNQLTTIAKT